MRVFLKYQLKEPTRVRTDRGATKKDVKKGMVLNFDIKMAEFYEEQYPRMFVQVDAPKGKKKDYIEAPKPDITKPNAMNQVKVN